MFTGSMRYDLGDDIHALQEQVHRFAQEKIKPLAAEVDRSNEFPAHLWKSMGDMGFLGVTVDEEYGGVGLGYLAHTIVIEEIARASASVSLSYGANSFKWHNRAKAEIPP